MLAQGANAPRSGIALARRLPLQSQSGHEFALSQDFPGRARILLGQILVNLLGLVGELASLRAALQLLLRRQPPASVDLGIARRQAVLANLTKNVVVFVNISDARLEPSQDVF